MPVLVTAGLTTTNGNSRRAIQIGRVQVNGMRVQNIWFNLQLAHFIDGECVLSVDDNTETLTIEKAIH